MDYFDDENITEEDYEIAKKNGISRENVYQRINTYAWDKEEAITVPVRERKSDEDWDEWKDVAIENGIDKRLYISRVRYQGFTREDAATRKRNRRLYKKWTDREYEIAKQNGIAGNGMVIPNGRLRLGWTREDAVRVPKMTKGREIIKKEESKC